jgi:hypothetical protein
MNYNDPRIRGVPRRKGPDLIVSLRESLIGDSRIANVVRPADDVFDPVSAEAEAYTASSEVASSIVAELPAFEAWREQRQSEEIAENSPGLSSAASFQESTPATERRPVTIRLIRGLVPGFLNLVAIAALVVLLGVGQLDKGLLLGAWETGRDWLSPARQIDSSVDVGKTAGLESGSSLLGKAPTVETVASQQDTQLQIQNLTNRLEAATKDFAVTKQLIDRLATKQDEITRNINDLQAAQAGLSQKIAVLHPRPHDNSADQLASQHDELARDIAALQAAQSTLSQKLSTLQSRPRVRAKGARSN